MDKSRKIVLIGSGNLAFHLTKRLVKKGHEMIQFVGRNAASTSELGMKYFTSHTTDIKLINKDADIYIICVNDSEIAKVAKQIKLPGKLIVHTSGTCDIDLLKDASDKTGVIYPLQTFSKDSKVKWAKIPVMVEGCNEGVADEVSGLAKSLSKFIVPMSSAERLKFHLAAVIACNFTNHLYSLSNEFLKAEKVDHFELLFPLIKETVKKIKKTDPKLAQTGPAKRGDKSTIATHLKLLAKYPETKEIYSVLSESIMNSKDGKL